MEILFNIDEAKKSYLAMKLLGKMNEAISAAEVSGSASGDVACDLAELAALVKEIQASISTLLESTAAFISNYSDKMQTADEETAAAYRAGGN